MTAQETSLLVGAVVGLFGAIQAWLINRAVVHGNQLNGVMTGRIQTGAQTAIAADHVARGVLPTVVPMPVDPTKAARIAALQTELAQLQA